MNENDAEQPAREVAGNEPALERVRAADPARDVQPDVPALRAAVDRRVTELPDGGALPEPGVVEDLSARRAARRWVPTSRPARVAAAAAAVLVVGGGGYAVGAAGDGTPAGPPAADVITLTGGGAGGSATAMAVPEAAGDMATSYDSDRMYWPGYSGRTQFTASGLSSEGGTGQGWGFDASQVYDEATLAALAAALGVDGTPTLNDGYWSVGPQDGSGPNIGLHPDGMASVYFYDPSTDPWYCAATLDGPAVMHDDAGSSEPATEEAPEPAPDAPVADVPDRELVDPSIGVMPVEPCTQRDLGPAPKGDAVVGQVRDLITALGGDPASFEVVTEDSEDASWSWVNAYQVVDGQRTGVMWSFTFTGAGLQSFNGSLAPLVSLGEYAVVSPVEAVQRLEDPRFGSGGYPIAYAAGATAAMAREGMVEAPQTPQPPTAASAGAPIAWPVNQVTIVEARLGSAIHYQLDGSAILVPTYELTGSDGSIWSVIAVADSALDFTAAR